MFTAWGVWFKSLLKKNGLCVVFIYPLVLVLLLLAFGFVGHFPQSDSNKIRFPRNVKSVKMIESAKRLILHWKDPSVEELDYIEIQSTASNQVINVERGQESADISKLVSPQDYRIEIYCHYTNGERSPGVVLIKPGFAKF